MKITRIINNNILCSLDEHNNEIIMTGCGLGYQRKLGDIIDESKIEKTYKLENKQTINKLQTLLEDIPLEHMDTCNRIIDYAKAALHKNLNENIYITLTDHISFAIHRFKNQLEYKNALLWEIKRFYTKEFGIGLQSLNIIEEELGVRLCEDEAGFIALHIANAQLGTSMDRMVQITTLIQDILGIVRDYYHITFDEESLQYERFITHLKFFGQRIFQNKVVSDSDYQFQSMIRDRYNNDYQCALLIKNYVQEKYQHHISEEEMMFLTVHLKRIGI